MDQSIKFMYGFGWFSLGLSFGLYIGSIVVEHLYFTPENPEEDDEVIINPPANASEEENDIRNGIRVESINMTKLTNKAFNRAYHKMYPSDFSEEADYDEFSEEDTSNYDRRPNSIDIPDSPEENDGIHEISFDDFAAAEPLMDKVSLTYYQEDDTLADDRDNIVHDVERILGEEGAYILQHDPVPNVFYIRNHDMGCDYEVALDLRGYNEVVFGVVPERIRKPPKKMRMDDD